MRTLHQKSLDTFRSKMERSARTNNARANNDNFTILDFAQLILSSYPRKLEQSRTIEESLSLAVHGEPVHSLEHT
jgi:hypothetical protein